MQIGVSMGRFLMYSGIKTVSIPHNQDSKKEIFPLISWSYVTEMFPLNKFKIDGTYSMVSAEHRQ